MHASREGRNSLSLPGIEHRFLGGSPPSLVSVPTDIFLIHSAVHTVRTLTGIGCVLVGVWSGIGCVLVGVWSGIACLLVGVWSGIGVYWWECGQV